ncbi:hypothetical protein JL721_7296 [Aureococcus anophagefferens]|nr:hypothetical protein JL721_7296 [Aureococcus anophagefferens]
MITCALLSRCSGSLSLITTSWALAGFWARKGVCPWWTVVVPLKNFCPRATVASAHASLNRSCSVVELFQALVLCFYQLQAAAVVVGRSAAESSNGGCEAQAALFQLGSLGAVVAHGVGLQRAVLRLVAHLAWCWIGGDAENEAHALGFGLWVVLAFLYAFWVHSPSAPARSALTPLGGFCFAMLAATSDGLWDRLCCVPKVGDRAERRGSAQGLSSGDARRRAAAGRAASRRAGVLESSLESFADEGLEEDEEKKVWCATANCAEAPTVAALLGARDDAEVAEKLRALLPRGYDVYALAVQECLCWAELVARSRRVLCDGGEAYECVGKGAIGPPRAPASTGSSAWPSSPRRRTCGAAPRASAAARRRRRSSTRAACGRAAGGGADDRDARRAAGREAPEAPSRAESAADGVALIPRARRASEQGAVAALVTFHDATLLFVGCHLPADGKAGAKLKKRHAAVRDALARAAEGLGVRGPAATCDAHLGAATHTFFLGDLNYRAPTARPRDTLDKVARACAADADAHDDPAAATDADAEDARALWDDALADDELRRERAAGRVFAGFSEPAIDFPPTYRYVAGARAAASEGYAHAPLLAAARADLFSLVKEKKRPRGGGEPSDVAASRAAEQRLAENPKLTISPRRRARGSGRRRGRTASSRTAPLRRDDRPRLLRPHAVEGSDHRAIDPGRHAAAPDLELDVSRLARASMVFPLPWEDPDVADRHLAGLAEALDAAGAPAIDVARAPWADRGVAVTADDVRRCLAPLPLALETADARPRARGRRRRLRIGAPGAGAFEVRLTRGTRAAPEFPLQFRAVVETTAHLVDRAQDYPPWLRRVQLDYYVNKRARAAVLLGLDAGKNFTRRYDSAQEYAVRGEPYPDCKRSYLGEAMPMPAYPSTAALAEADVDIDGSRHERWLVDIPGAERTHVYTNEALVDGAYVPLMTYDFVEFEAVAPAEAAFDLDAPSAARLPFHHYLMV